jgi:dTDP-4-amino-4,6-dideoxygalactose transaminase
LYREGLSNIPGVALLSAPKDTVTNSAYFPIFITPEYGITRDELYYKLREHGIYGRRYFYPLISDMPMYRGYESANPARLPNAKKISEQVICLPIYPNLADDQVQRVIAMI